MSSINPLSVAAAGTTGAQTTMGGQAGLGKDDFLKLLVGQLRHQDPMNPSTDQDFIGQMAQFSMVEQVSNLAQTMRVGQTFNMLGKTVTYKDSAGAVATGVVEKVTVEGGEAKLTVAGNPGIDPATVTEVK